jgi:hypothetical protein
MRSLRLLTLLTAVALVTIVAGQVDAQQQRGGRRGGGPGQGFSSRGGGGKLALLRVDAVKKELELLDEQSADIDKLTEELRSRNSGDRPDFRNMSDEERRAAFEKMRAEREALSEEERSKQDEQRRSDQRKLQQEADGKLAEILLPHQMDRLGQIEIQTQGVSALTTEFVAKELGLSNEAREGVQTTIRESGEKLRAQMQELFRGGNREGIREKMEEFRNEINEAVLATLTQSQREKFTELKGEPFEMPRRGFGGGRGGEGRRGGEGGRGRRPQRPTE